MVTEYKGNLPGFFKVYYNSKSLMNILSFKDARKVFRLTADTAEENCIVVHVGESKVLKFYEVTSGLYMWSPE